MKIGFIGTGNMATAIARGMVTNHFVEGEKVYLFDVLSDKVKALGQEIGGQVCNSTKQLLQEVDVVVLSVKPDIIEKVLVESKSIILERKPLIVSIAAGTPLAKISGYLNVSDPLAIVRVMPNVNATIGLGAAAVCGNEYVTEQQLDYVVRLFESVGKAWVVEESHFSNFTALAGSSPAYAYLFIDSLARAGVKHGLPKELATQFAAQAVLGSAQMILESGENPWTLIDRVCSPGGTTVAGLLALEEEAFTGTIVKGIDATINRDKEMNEK
ncbi:pyrroline-5-carboxylate reductase [Sporosarcina sp. HYO08]|uniref:pyrroline-5-carboxylate reductase n=1 Tax=Sporosarcina sp. HYO08 TaxID=1759557 RepID=UPI000798FF90|nr:pyrroline-5-carboxylate reductase [Sporosarcina sp. HYO08]KXH86959.1 pyrroline-5-carboxylate reductase [Sporosarcina sp. HYO08]